MNTKLNNKKVNKKWMPIFGLIKRDQKTPKSIILFQT